MSDQYQEEYKESALESMNSMLGSNYQIVSDGKSEPMVLAKLPDEDLMPKNSVMNKSVESSQPIENESAKPAEKTNDDYLFQFYLGSLTVVGLFVLFRMIQKSR
jgi:hypothetical protein